jgi:hypothetical protein
MNSNDTHTAVSFQPDHQQDASIPEESTGAKPAKAIRKSIRIEQMKLHRGFDEFTSSIAKITFELKDVGSLNNDEEIKEILRYEIKVICAGENYEVVEGIRCWQIAASIFPPKTKIDVMVVPSHDDDDVFTTAIRELVVKPIIFQVCHAGSLELVSLYGVFNRDPRFKPILDRIFRKRPTKDQFAELIGLRPTRIYSKGKANISTQPDDQDVTATNQKESGNE